MVNPTPDWTVTPAAPEVTEQLWAVTRVFAAGVLGGAISLTALGLLVAPTMTSTSGSTRSLRIDRQRRALCMQLRITPEELAQLEASGELSARLAELQGPTEQPE